MALPLNWQCSTPSGVMVLFLMSHLTVWLAASATLAMVYSWPCGFVSDGITLTISCIALGS